MLGRTRSQGWSRVSNTVGARLGFGVSGPLGAKWFSEKKLCALVDSAIEGGVRRFDTAGFYGEAETRLGKALHAHDDAKISTKTGTKRLANGKLVKDFSEAAIRADVEVSLVGLGRERIDILYLHGPDPNEVEIAAPTLEALKKEGKVASVGTCNTGLALRMAVRTGIFDAAMAPFNLINRENEEGFKIAKAQDMETAAIAPLAQGVFHPSFFKVRRPADAWRLAKNFTRNREELKRAKSIWPNLKEIEGWTPAQAALGFVLAHDFIDLALTTTTDPSHLAESIDASVRFMPPKVVSALSGAIDLKAA